METTTERNTRRIPWLVAGALLTVASIVGGAITVVSVLGRHTESETEHRTYSVRVARIVVDMTRDGGHLTILRGRPGEVTVERRLTWAGAKPKVDERWDGRNLRITADCPDDGNGFFGFSCDIGYTVRVPADAAVEAHVSSGDLQVRGVRGRLSLFTAAGDVRASDLTSPQVNVHSSAGDVRLGFAKPPRRVEAVADAGNVGITVPNGGYNVSVDTDAGDERVDVTRDPTALRTIVARSHAGDVRIEHG